MKKLAFTAIAACLLAGPVLAAPAAPLPDTGASVLENCPGKPKHDV